MLTGTIGDILLEADAFLDSGQKMRYLHDIDDPSKMKTREEVIGRQAVVALKLNMLFCDVKPGVQPQTEIDLIQYNARVYMALARRDSELAQQGLTCDPAKVKLIGVQ